MKTLRFRRGFTVIELLSSAAIVACLVGLLMPAIATLRARAESTACAANLRQIGVAALLYAGEHDQRFPTIEPWPSSPLYSPDDGAKTLSETFEPYGITQRSLTCRRDIAGPDYRAREGSSYQWFPMANGQNLQSVNLGWVNLPGGVSLSSLLLAFDYTNIHGGASNVLFGDGHVGGASGR